VDASDRLIEIARANVERARDLVSTGLAVLPEEAE